MTDREPDPLLGSAAGTTPDGADPDAALDQDLAVDPDTEHDPDLADAAPITPIRRTPNRKASMMIAAGMFAIDDLLGRKPKEEAPIVVDANGEPVDIDTDGIVVRVANAAGEEVSVAAPALPRSRPLPGSAPARRRRNSRRA